MHVSDTPRPTLSPLVAAALLLTATPYLKQYELAHPTGNAILAATGATRSQAYKLAGVLRKKLAELQKPVGRPPNPEPNPSRQSDTEVIRGAALEYVMSHPGCVSIGQAGQRHRYSDPYRRFIVELRAQYSSVATSTFAEAVCIPKATMEDWLRNIDDSLETYAQSKEESLPSTTDKLQLKNLHIQTIASAYESWHGPFTAFCEHVRNELGLPYGPTFIGNVLKQLGLRTPESRGGRSPDEKALRGAFATFFPGAQWVGDGTTLEIEINGERFSFNLELLVDADSGAVVGASIRDEEDAEAVIEAFADAVATTEDAPLSVLLDNRASNHTEDVAEALGQTIPIRATLGRPQNKAHVEGAFGLFQQTAPPLVIRGKSPRQLAASILRLIVMTWARTLNRKPRTDRGGRSRSDIYQQGKNPSSEESERARAALEERQRRQQKAYDTQKARQNPTARRILDDAFKRLGLVDPDGNVQIAIARYPLDVIIEGIAIFEGKLATGFLPDEPARYLLGIIKGIHGNNESLHMFEALLRLRLQARDHILEPLRNARSLILGNSATDPFDSFLSRALDADSQIERIFWLQSLGDHLTGQSIPERIPLIRRAARLIQATYRLPYRQRGSMIRFLARRVLPLD